MAKSTTALAQPGRRQQALEAVVTRPPLALAPPLGDAAEDETEEEAEGAGGVTEDVEAEEGWKGED